MTTKLIITIDTEPDNQWQAPDAEGRLLAFRFANTRGLARLVDFFAELNIPPTWLTSHSIATDPKSIDALLNARACGGEIGGHLHGWETPPFVPNDSFHRSFIYEYDEPIRWQKHQALVAAHEQAFGVRPYSYRAGRWGIDELEYSHLERLGYGIDSSIPVGIDFRDRAGREALGPDFRRYCKPDGLRPYRVGKLMEVPVSIAPIGTLDTGGFAHAVARYAANRHRPISISTGLCKALEITHLQRMIWLRPLRHPRHLLVQLAKSLVAQEVPIINIMFHSSEAYLDTSPLSRGKEDVDRLYGDLRAIIKVFMASGKVEAAQLSDAVPNSAVARR